MRYILYLLSSCFLLNISGQSNTAVSAFLKNPNLKYASIGVCIKDLNNSNTIVSYNKSTALVPASILKVVTSATAVEILGESYCFKTDLATDKNNPQNIIIHGYGDPTLGSEYLYDTPDAFLANWYSTINKKINRNLPISITIRDDYFGYNGVSRKWIREDMGNYFAAGSYGISIFDNTYLLSFNTMRTDTCPVIERVKPRVKGLKFTNLLRLNYNNKDNGYICGEPLSFTRTLIGDIPAGKNSFSIKGDIPDPGLMLGNVIADYFTDKGHMIENVSTSQSMYIKQIDKKERTALFDEDVFYSHQSPPLKDIIKILNVRSNNHYSEHLMRAIGRTKNPDIYSDPLIEGIEETSEYWEEKGIDTKGMRIYDGCGLSPSNCVSPEMICDILVYMRNKSTYAESFDESLPKAGKEGTVRNFLKGTRLEGKVVVKSGSIAKVQCFAGYYINGQKKYAFTVMVNNFNGSHRETVKAIETMLLNIF